MKLTAIVQLAFNCSLFVCLVSYFTAGTSPQKSIGARSEQVPFSMAIENGELMNECFPKHLRMGTARLKLDNETEEENKKRRMIVEISTVDTKTRSPVQSLCRVVTLIWQYIGTPGLRSDSVVNDLMP